MQAHRPSVSQAATGLFARAHHVKSLKCCLAAPYDHHAVAVIKLVCTRRDQFDHYKHHAVAILIRHRRERSEVSDPSLECADYGQQ